MRKKIIGADVIECIIGLGPNLFYGASMEACIVVCRKVKPKERKNNILFINAINEVTRIHNQSFLTDEHIKHVAEAYLSFAEKPNFSKVISLEEIRKNIHSLKIDLFVTPEIKNEGDEIKDDIKNEFVNIIKSLSVSRVQTYDSLATMLPTLKITCLNLRNYQLILISRSNLINLNGSV